MRRSGAGRSTSGNASIEFALILLPFCLLLFGMIDYGWYFWVDLVCTNAVREGARTATTIPGGCPNALAATSGTTAVTNYYTGLLPPSYAPTVTPACTTVTLGNPPVPTPQFKYTLQLSFAQLTGFSYVRMPGSGGNVTIQTSATMRGIQ